jgi:mRNA-degrading endonuclease RelE of RelBE toxin-antitoxin system
MLTVIESPLFSALWPDYWTEEERGAFAAFLATNPDAGDLIVGSGGCRKIRWALRGRGKSGGVRVIYTVRLKNGSLVLLTIYGKSAQDSIPRHILRKLAEELGNAD